MASLFSGTGGAAIAYTIIAVDKASRVIKKTGTNLDQLTRKLKKAEKTSMTATESMSAGFSKLTGKLKGLAVGYAAALGAGKIIEIGASFQTSLAEIESVTGITGKSLDAMGDSSLKMSKKYGIAGKEINRAITLVASANSDLMDDPKALLDVTEVAVKLAKAGAITTDQSVGVLVGSLNQFNKGSEYAQSFADMLAQSTNVGAAEYTDLISSLRMAGPIAASNNVTFSETNALLQVMAKAGLKGSMAGTGLAGVQAALVAKGGWDPKKMGLTDALAKIKEIYGDDSRKMLKLFGQEHLKSALAIMANIDTARVWKKEIEEGSDLDRQVAARSATFRSKMNKLQMTIQEKMIKLFLIMEPKLSKFVQTIGTEIDKINPGDLERISQLINGLMLPLKMIYHFISTTVAILGDIGAGLGEGAAMAVNWISGGADPDEINSMYSPVDSAAQSISSTKDGSTIDINLNDPSNMIKEVKSSALPGVKKKSNVSIGGVK